MSSLNTENIYEALSHLSDTVNEYIEAYSENDENTKYQNNVTESEWNTYLKASFIPYFQAVKQLESQLKSFEEINANSETFSIMQSLNSIDSQIQYAATIIQMKSNPFGSIKSSVANAAKAASAVGTLISRVGAILKGLAGQIWQLLSKLINIKEWSVKGAVSSPALTGFFGVTGSLELSITFQP